MEPHRSSRSYAKFTKSCRELYMFVLEDCLETPGKAWESLGCGSGLQDAVA